MATWAKQASKLGSHKAQTSTSSVLRLSWREEKKPTRAREQDYRFNDRMFMSCTMFILIGAYYIIAIRFAYAWYCLLNLSR